MFLRCYQRILRQAGAVMCCLLPVFAGPVWAVVPDQGAPGEEAARHRNFVVAQTAGYLGYAAAGVGRQWGTHAAGLLAGYVPEQEGGVEIWQLSLKYDWHPWQANRPSGNAPSYDPFYIGLSMIYGMHPHLFVETPKHYPEDYYSPTAIRFTLNLGAAVQYEHVTLYLEYSFLDVGLIAYLKNHEFFKENYDYYGLEGVGSLGLGIKLSFGGGL